MSGRLKMNCGPLATITDEALSRIEAQAGEQILKQFAEVPDELGNIAKLCVAATGGHVAIEDSFYFGCLEQLTVLKRKEQERWKSHVSDGKGTRRRVYWDGMLRINDDRGVAVPVVPVSVSRKVNQHTPRHGPRE